MVFSTPSDKRCQFRNMLTTWLLANSLSDSTRHKIQGTIQWYDSGAHGLLPPAYWFLNQDIRLVLGRDREIALWKQLGTPNWEDWFFMEETTGPARPYDYLSWDSLQQFLQPSRL